MTTPSDDHIEGDASHQLYVPPEPNWQWSINGDWQAMTVSLVMEKPPSLFHRLTQRLFLGIHWRKIL